MFDAVSLCVWTAADWAELCLTGEKYLDSSTCGGVGIGVAACTGTVAFLLESEVLLFWLGIKCVEPQSFPPSFFSSDVAKNV